MKQTIMPFVAGGIGLVFYLSRFPEKLLYKGTVDILGASHQVQFCKILFVKLNYGTSHMTIYGAQGDQKMTGSGPEVICEGSTRAGCLRPTIFL